MTPSNANTSGLKNAGHVVWWKAGGVNYFPEGEAFTVSESCRVEPLVTAASAQARIAELEAERDTWKTMAENGAQALPRYVSRATAAEARADRLAKALEEIRDLGSDGEHSGDRHARCRSIARESLPAIPPGKIVGSEIHDEADHFFNCASCGQAVDMRDLGEVFRHEEADHEARKPQ